VPQPATTNPIICPLPPVGVQLWKQICPSTGAIIGVYYDSNCVLQNYTECPTPSPPSGPPSIVECTTCGALPTVIDGANGDLTSWVCPDGTPGGVICDTSNRTYCVWRFRNCTKPSPVVRKGFCPLSPPGAANTVCVSPNTVCASDGDCNDNNKCCPDPCGITCKPALDIDPTQRPGNCPAVANLNGDSTGGSVIGPCLISCQSDANCSDTQKCCSTACGGLVCQTLTTVIPAPCATADCPVPSLDSVANTLGCCPGDATAVDSTTCVRVGGQCQLVHQLCPPRDPRVVHVGFCPDVSDTLVTPNCTETCILDNDCDSDKRCCYHDHCGEFACISPVALECVTTGYRNMRCLSRAVAASLFINGTPSVPDNGIYLSEDCYRCAKYSVCAVNSNNTCAWDANLETCLQQCHLPPPTDCGARTPCGCLESSSCSWCQFSRTFTSDSSANTETVTFGTCINKELSNKCIAGPAVSGFNGTVVTTRPAACDSSNLPLGTSNPPDALADRILKAIFELITNGTFTEGDFESFLARRGITDIRVVFIAQPTCDSASGRIRIVIEIGARTLLEYQTDITAALAARFSISAKSITTILQPEQSASGSSGKRNAQGTGGTYFATSQVTTPAPPQPANSPSINPTNIIPQAGSSGYLVTPIWLVTLLSFLFLRR